MIRITKTIKVKADYDIIQEFDSVEDLMNELKINFGYEGEYDETKQEFIDVLNEYFDVPLHTRSSVGVLENQHQLDNIKVDTENFETFYTFNPKEDLVD